MRANIQSLEQASRQASGRVSGRAEWEKSCAHRTVHTIAILSISVRGSSPALARSCSGCSTPLARMLDLVDP